MIDILEIILKWAIPFILTSAASATIAYGKASRKKATDREEESNKRMKAVEEGVQCLLRAEIIRTNEKYENCGYCPYYEKESLKRAYTAYHALGGNDIATKLVDDVLALPENQA